MTDARAPVRQQHTSLFAYAVRCLVPPSRVPGRRREYHRVLWIIAALLAVDFVVRLPSEYAGSTAVLVALILTALLPAFR